MFTHLATKKQILSVSHYGKALKKLQFNKKNCLQWGLNSWPLVYKTSALPLSYRGFRWGLNTFDKSLSQICLGKIKSIVCCGVSKISDVARMYQNTPLWSHQCKEVLQYAQSNWTNFIQRSFFEQFFFSELAKEMNDMIAILAHSHLEIVIQAMAKKIMVCQKA